MSARIHPDFDLGAHAPPGCTRVPCDVDEESLALAVSGFQSAAVPGKRSAGRLALIDYAGVLTVADPAMFVAALASGLGRAKAYGYGLMLIRRI